MSHDVDWSYNGPSRNHILERKDRFDDDLFANTPINDLYRNFSEFMEIEEKYEKPIKKPQQENMPKSDSNFNRNRDFKQKKKSDRFKNRKRKNFGRHNR